MTWETVIGLEIHAQLATKSKIFSGASTQFGALPNTEACAIDLGFPGVLPVLNQEAVTMAIKFGIGVQAEIASHSVFDRKNYFYPDLPKGYQISQFTFPVVKNGHMDIRLEDGQTKRIHITRAHLEEDAGKSLHDAWQHMSGIDLNRAGTPLLEIVSEPDMRSAKEAVLYLKAIHTLVRYLEICDGNMQEGSFRCDANVSVRKVGATQFGTRAEIKNVNSFRFVERAIEVEVERQISILESGGTVMQETRLYDPDKNETRSMRQKEEANDYRYFPDPDLLPLAISAEWIDSVRKTLPELPQEKRGRFMTQYGLSEYDAILLSNQKELADYYETVVSIAPSEPKLAANWVASELLGALNQANLTIATCPIPATELGQLIARIADQTLSGKMAKTVFESLFKQEGQVDEIITKRGLKQVTDAGAIEQLVDQIMAANPEQVTQYRSGKDKLFGFFVGQAMKQSGGTLNPEQLNAILKKKLAG
jgi:aspartyl-tRNA(Asn)/glutamyl-tRNA(Gln) amidotransferase subunit B